MNSNLRKDVDFQGIFRKLGHSLEEIRVRALENILSKLEHQLICEADIVHEKHLYIRLLEWFNTPNCSHKGEVLALLNRLAQHSAGAKLLQSIGGIEFLSQLRVDIEACHRPTIDQILDSTMRLPDGDDECHAPECIYQRPSESAVWGASMSSVNDGSRTLMSHMSENHSAHSMNAGAERLGNLPWASPGYFAPDVMATSKSGAVHTVGEAIHGVADFFTTTNSREQSSELFRLSTFPWLPLTQTDQQVIASTNSSLQTKDPNMLIGACEFLADVVFQDFPAEIFLQRPEILKSLLSMVSLPAPANHSVVIQACNTLTTYARCLQVRIRLFQDPVIYTSKQDFNSTTPSLLSSAGSSTSQLPPFANGQQAGFGGRRHRGDGQDGDSSTSASRESSIGLEPTEGQLEDDFDLEDGPRLQSVQLTLPQFCVAVLQRALPRLRTAHEPLGVAVLGLAQETMTILSSVLDSGIWSDLREPAREVVDRLSDCLCQVCELLQFHHHSNHAISPINAELGDLATHRLLYMGTADFITQFLLMIPLEKMTIAIPERMKTCLPSLVYDEPLAVLHPRCRAVLLAVTHALGLSIPVDFQRVMEVCRSINKTCTFCLHAEQEDLKTAELVNLAEEGLLSLNYHLHLPFASKFVAFMSRSCSKKKTDKALVGQCVEVLLKLMSYPVESVRQVTYMAILDSVKGCLQVSQATSPSSKEYLKAKFVINADVLYEMATFGLADQNAKVRSCSADCLHHLLQAQLLMSDALWQELTSAMVKSLPILQSYTDQTNPLGRRLWSMLDPTSSTHNLSLLEKLRGCIRLLLLSDKNIRNQAAKHIKWFMGNEQGSDMKQPSNLEPSKIDACLIVNTPKLLDEDQGRSVFTVEGMKQVFDIFTSDPVDPGVKKSAGEQLAIMIKDPCLHGTFKENRGVEIVCSVLQKAVLKKEDGEEKKDDLCPFLPSCLSMLTSLTHHDYTLRHTLAKDNDLYYCLLRVSLLYGSMDTVKVDVAHLLSLLVFDEVAKIDIGPGQADTPGTWLSLPAQVIKRYRLPFKPQCHHISSPNTTDLQSHDSDIMTTSGPREMMRVTWNVAWQGGFESLLDALNTRLFSETRNEFSSELTLTPIDRIILEASNVTWMLHNRIAAVRSAGSHQDVILALSKLTSYNLALQLPKVCELYRTTDWYSALEKFLQVTPSSASDQALLLQVLKFISSALLSVSNSSNSTTNPALSWLSDRLYRSDGPMVTLLSRPMGGANDELEAGSPVKRSLDKEILHYIISINSQLPYQVCQRGSIIHQRGDLVRQLQHRLNINEAPHFYNLASLEGTLACLMHVTARPGWSRECSELDSLSLCSQLLNSLLEVVWSFHIGRGGTSRSFMGKGVTKSTTLCLRHLAYEMIRNADDEEWVKNWLYSHQDNQMESEQGLNWLMTLWAYRDPEVRTAGVGLAVALTSCEAGRVMVSSHCKHIPGGIWGAAFSILLDPVECSAVCQQAALLLVNLTSQTMPSGDVELSAGTWQGPLVTDTEYQVMLVGVNALVALLEHTNFYTVVCDLLGALYPASQIQPVLITSELPPLIDSLMNSSLSSTTEASGSLDKTALTALTSVSSLTTPHLTDRSKTAGSTSDRAKEAMVNPQENSGSSNSAAHTPNNTPRNQQDANIPLGQVISIATPGLLSAVVKLLTNLTTLTPQTCLANLRSRAFITALMGAVSPSTAHSLHREMTSGQPNPASAVAFKDLMSFYGSIADFLTCAVTVDTNTREEVLENKSGLHGLASLVLLTRQTKDDLGEVCTAVSVSVLRLMVALLQGSSPTAHITLTGVLGHIWVPLTETLCMIMGDSSPSQASLHSISLDFIALLCCEEAKSLVKNPDRVIDKASVSELLDTPLQGNNAEQDDPIKTTGKALCKAIVKLFDACLSVSQSGTERSGVLNSEGRLRVISALKSLLAVSQSAKEVALDAGIVEQTLEHIKQTHAQLNLETLGLVKSTGKKDEPFLQELVVMFDFLHNFMTSNSDVKVACQHSGLTSCIQRLWSWCLEDNALLTSTLSLLVSYSAHCNSAASSLASSGTLANSNKPGSQASIMHYILRLAQRELDRDLCSPTLRLTFTLLTNLALSAECRNVLWKNPFLNQFSGLNPRRKRGKVRVVVESLWCELLLALSFSVDGQQIILKIPDVLTVLIDMMEAGSTRCQSCATLIIRNMCCHAPNKPKLLAHESLINALTNQVETKTEGNLQLVASSAMWALVYNNHKARVQVKNANVAPRFAESLRNLQKSGSRSQLCVDTCENLKAVINAVRD